MLYGNCKLDIQAGNLYTGRVSRGCITLKEHLPIVAMETCKFGSHSRGIHSNIERDVKQEKY